MNGCNEKVFDYENAKSNAEIAANYGSELSMDFGMINCGEPAVRDGKCDKHKVERRRRGYIDDRRRPGSTDTPPSCGNSLCCSEIASGSGQVYTRHDTRCPDYGPGWA